MKRGFTLFEVLISLALSVVLMSMIGFAMQFYAQQLNLRDSEARRSQLARSILKLISEDLQACLYPEEFDPSQLADLLAATSGGEAGGDSVGGDSGDSTLDVEDSESVVDEEDTTDLSTSLVSTIRPGLVGNQYQLQFDISRLPRLEEYLPMLTDATELGIQDIPSDIKTVSYYVQQAGQGAVGDAIAKLANGGDSAESAGGLVRRSLDREISSYASESGDLVRLEQSGDLLAPEVLQIEFAYFDGTQWIYEWNSDTNEGLPLAIQIRLTLNNGTSPGSSDGLAVTTTIGETGVGEIYDIMVKLPMAVLPPEEDETDEDLESVGI